MQNAYSTRAYVRSDPMFQRAHLLFLAFTATTIPAIAAFLHAQSPAVIGVFLRVIAVVILFFDPVYWFWEWRQNKRFDFSTTLPLYICSLFWMMLPVAAFAEDGIIRQIALANVSTIGLMGGVFGILFNVHLEKYAFCTFVPVRSLVYHYFMVLVPVVLWTSGYYVPTSLDFLWAMLPVFLILVISLVLHEKYQWDYCYTAGGIGTPLEKFSARMSKPVFLFVLYGGLTVFLKFFFYRGV